MDRLRSSSSPIVPSRSIWAMRIGKKRRALALLISSMLLVTPALVLFSVTFSLRVAVDDPNALLANFYTVPIALVAAELGWRAGRQVS